MKKGIRLVIVLLLSISGISACYAGVSLIFRPDGKSLGLSLNQLLFLPFRTYLLPGILLLVVPGFGSLFAAASLALKKPWGPFFAGIQACILLVWIIIQTNVIPNYFIQYFFGTIAIVLISSAFILYRMGSSHASDV